MTYATLCACRRLQLNKMPGTTFCVARRGAAGKVNSKLQVSFFYPFVPNFCLVPSREGKIRNILGKKIGTEPGKNSVAGAEPLGRSWLERAGPRWRTGQGWGQGPGRAGGGAGGRACSYINTTGDIVGCRNRLECRFGAEYRGEILVFLPDFPIDIPDFPLVLPDFSRGKNPANLRGKSCSITKT